MSLLAHYDPPGDLTDFGSTGLQQWSSFISDRTDASIKGNPGNLNDSPRSQYYNLTKTETAGDATLADVSWVAFPRQVKIRSATDIRRWRTADSSRDVQDEYCEWNVTRNSENKITRVTFTCEGPEYWEILARTDADTVVALYQEHISQSVRKEDLFDSNDRYIARNRWNTDPVHGAMHLVQAANTLSAEIELVAAATIVRKIDGTELSGEQELIACGRYGAPERHSDPHIGGVVNSVARQKADVSLANPVGLYFNDLAVDGWAAPDGSDPKSYWTYTRGSEGRRLRAVYEVPAEAGFTVSDITILGQPIRFGAQIADFISIKASVVACRIGQSVTAPKTACVVDSEVVTPAFTIDDLTTHAEAVSARAL